MYSRMHGDPDEDEFRSDELVRVAAEVMDPMHGKAVPPPRVTAAELIKMAERRNRPTVRIPWRWLKAPALVGALVLMVIGAANFLPVVDRRSGGLSRVEPALPGPLQLPYATNAPPARERLLALATAARAANEPGRPGRYTYVHTRVWSLDTTAGPAQPRVQCRDEQLWWAPDGSGREEIAEFSGRCADVSLPAGDAQVTRYGPGELKVVIPAPASLPPVLASQLADHEDLRAGPQAMLRAVAAMFHFHALGPDHRAAVLQVLADTSGLVHRGTVRDGAGRSGTAISADSDAGATRDVAVFDPADGRLLAYERVALRSPARSAIRAPAVTDAVLFLEAERTDDLG